MNITISPHVLEAIAKEKLNPKQIRMIGQASMAIYSRGLDPLEYRIQFDCNRSITGIGHGKPCQASLYIKKLGGPKVFTSRFGNLTAQLGLAKFIKDYS